MHDIKWIRDNPAAFDAGLQRRGLQPMSTSILELDKERRGGISEREANIAKKNQISKQIGLAKRNSDEAEVRRLMADALLDDAVTQAFEQVASNAEQRLSDLLAGIPNLPAGDVPQGNDESGNIELKKIGEPRQFNFEPRDHVALGEGLGLMDFAAAAKLSGARFVVLKGALARLERALAQFMLDLHTDTNGYTEIDPPLLVKDSALYGTGQLPKFAQDQFVTTGDATERRWLIPTAEVSLTNLVADEIVDGASLPLRYTAFTPCFRSEAGAAGRDTRGMIRQHQFPKVEMVSIVAPDQSDAEHERMTRAAESVLEKLKLPYRRIVLCSGDMGFSALKTFDLEVWLPGQNAYREISSCSNCGDFQARRMNARFRKAGEKGTQFVHTLNGSGVAVGRALVAVLENYQQEDGSVLVPDALKPYMGGLDRIDPPAPKGKPK
ncbi:MAG: serine--tRNA ligase [Rhodospirillales bacterium]